MEPGMVVGLLLALPALWRGAAAVNFSMLTAHSKEECCGVCTRDPHCILAVHNGTLCWLRNSTSDDEDEEMPAGEVACKTKADNRTKSEAEPYDCKAGSVHTWPSGKAEWCCIKQDVGCPFSCSLGYPEQKVAWSAEKKAWCCIHRQVLCGEHKEVHRAVALQSGGDNETSIKNASSTNASTSEAPSTEASTSTEALKAGNATTTVSANSTTNAPTTSAAATQAPNAHRVLANTTTKAPTTSAAATQTPNAHKAASKAPSAHQESSTKEAATKSPTITEESSTREAATKSPTTTKVPKSETLMKERTATPKPTKAQTTTGTAAPSSSGAATSKEAPTTTETTAPSSSRAATSKEVPATSKTRVATAGSVSTTGAMTTKSPGTTEAPTEGHAAQCRCSQDTDYTGHDLAALPAKTPEECCQACAVHPDCTVGILYVGRCWLKNSSAVVPRSPGRIACSAGKAHYLAEANAVRGASCSVHGCGGYNPTHKCQCNAECKKYENCCFDYVQECVAQTEASCKRYGCGAVYVAERPCQCNSKCHFYGNCCSDYRGQCGKATGASTLVFKKFELPAGPETLIGQTGQGNLMAVVAQAGQGRLLVLASALLMAVLAVAVRLRRPRHGAAQGRHAGVARDETVEGGMGVADEDHGESLLAWWAE